MRTTTKAKTTKATRTIVGKRAKAKTTKAPRATRKPKAVEVEVVQPVKKSGSVVPQHFKTKAGKSGVLRNDAIGNAVTDAFLGGKSPRDAADAILKENSLEVGRWAGKNPGMLSMNLKNVLRGLSRNGVTVLVRGKKFLPE